MNTGTSKRTPTDPLGDLSQPTVVKANTIVSRFVLLVLLASARDCVFLVEQPRSSLMPYHPRWMVIRHLCAALIVRNTSFLFLRRSRSAVCSWCPTPHAQLTEPSGAAGVLLPWGETFFWMGLHGASTPKRSMLWGTAPYVRRVRTRNLVRATFLLNQKEANNKPTVRVYKNKLGLRRVQGGPGLKATQAYPKGFCKIIAVAHKEYLSEALHAPCCPKTVEAHFSQWPDAMLDDVLCHDQIHNVVDSSRISSLSCMS